MAPKLPPPARTKAVIGLLELAGMGCRSCPYRTVIASAPLRFGKNGEDREDQGLALQVELLDLAGGAVDLFPSLGNSRHPRGFLRHGQARGEPGVHGIHKGRQRLW